MRHQDDIRGDITDGRTYRLTDRPFYRDAMTQVEVSETEKKYEKEIVANALDGQLYLKPVRCCFYGC